MRFRPFLLLLMLVLAPLRAGIAIVEDGRQKDVSVAASHAGYGEPHGHGQAPRQGGQEHASCLEHCTGAALVSPAPQPVPAARGGGRIDFVARAAPAFFPDPLDPPPLAG